MLISREVYKLVNAITTGYLARKSVVAVPLTKLNVCVLNLLRGLFLSNGFTIGSSTGLVTTVMVLLKYSAGKPVINTLRVVGTSVSYRALRDKSSYRNALIVSTSQGILTRSEALALGVGGIVLLELS